MQLPNLARWQTRILDVDRGLQPTPALDHNLHYLFPLFVMLKNDSINVAAKREALPIRNHIKSKVLKFVWNFNCK